eukprot:7382866-Prymnesium_polylepis.1
MVVCMHGAVCVCVCVCVAFFVIIIGALFPRSKVRGGRTALSPLRPDRARAERASACVPAAQFAALLPSPACPCPHPLLSAPVLPQPSPAPPVLGERSADPSRARLSPSPHCTQLTGRG